jgi:hypothetical protein
MAQSACFRTVTIIEPIPTKFNKLSPKQSTKKRSFFGIAIHCAAGNALQQVNNMAATA